MSLKANYFKLGLFVVGAFIAGVIVIVVIGSGRWFQPRLSIETYFNESVQGLDVGSKLKYRGVVIGEVKSIGFTYNKYQQDKPMQQRARYVLVEAQIQPRLLGGRAGAGDLTEQKSADLEIERGLRMRLAPQGITGTSYLEIDYVEPVPATPVIGRARPKSRILTWPSESRNTFSGFRSRWTSPRSCAAARPRAICTAYSTTFRPGTAPCARRSRSVSPCRSSVTTYKEYNDASVPAAA